MAAAQPIGDYWPDVYRATPFQHEITAPPLETYVMAPALGDPEDPFPTARERADMPKDEQDYSREAATLVPETDREPERQTQPPGPADAEATRVMETMLPEAPKLPDHTPLSLEDSYLDRAIRVVADAGAKLAVDRDERQQQHEAVLAAISRSEGNAQKNYELLRNGLKALQKSDAQQDAKIADLRLEVAALKEQLGQAMNRLTELEQRIPDDAAEGTAAEG